MNLSEFRKRFDSGLEDRLSSAIMEMEPLVNESGIFDAIQQLDKLSQSGKRVRPYILYTLYHGVGGEDEDLVLDVGVALESFHLFCLVHDDVMDKADIRRGSKTVHAKVRTVFEEDEREGDLSHIANAQAILTGDLLFAWVLGWFCEVLRGSEHTDSAYAEIKRMINEVMAGQMIDVNLMSRVDADFSLIERKMYLKTASYTFIRPMRLGAAMAGANGKVLEFCDTFGKALGLGFQIQDDLLDIVGTEGQIKKPTLSDLHERQHTIFTQFVFERGDEKHKKKLRELFGKELNDTQKQQARDLFTDSGAITYGEERMRKHFNRAETVLQDAPISGDARENLSRLLAFIKNRRS